MNRAKQQMTCRAQKKMAKTIRAAQGQYPVTETQRYSDELTAKELLKKYPKNQAKKQAELLKASQARLAVKHKKKLHEKMPSKRTSPGMGEVDSTPAHVHPEGGRWIKTLIKQNLASRVIQSHKAGGKDRKK